MPELTLQNIEQIRTDISKQDISFSHLLDELTDHLCCDVENEMMDGLTFEDAYRKVRSKISPDRFSEIQKETLYEVDTKYRKMKNTMKISGITGTALFGLAALFKIQHWPFASIMLFLGAITLSFVFLPAAMGVLWKETHNRKRIFLLVAAFLTGFFFIMGTLFKVNHWPAGGIIFALSALFMLVLFIPALISTIFRDPDNKPFRPVYLTGTTGLLFLNLGMIFKIQHWPLATALILIGMLLTGFIFLPWYSKLKWKDEANVSPVFLFLVIGAIFLIVPGALINMNMQNSYDQGFYNNHEQQRALHDYLTRHNTSLLKDSSLKTPEIEKLSLATNELILLINEVKTGMVQEAEEEPKKDEAQSGTIDSGSSINYMFISDRFNTVIPRQLFPSGISRRKLEQALKNYSESITPLIPSGRKEQLDQMLAPEIYFPCDTIREYSLLSALHSLDLLENTILVIEHKIMSSASQSLQNSLSVTSLK